MYRETGFFGDFEYLFKKFDKPRSVYRKNTTKSNKIAKEVNIYNDHFSETLFTSWVSSIFLRYAFLVSKEQNEKISVFEKLHMSFKTKKIQENLMLYKFFKFISVKFVDLVEFSHSPSYDTLLLRVCVNCSGIIGKKSMPNSVEEQRMFYYDIEFVKDNVKTATEKMKDYTSNCPSCGAPTNIETYGICDYCQEIVSIFDNVWKIKSLTLLD